MRLSNKSKYFLKSVCTLILICAASLKVLCMPISYAYNDKGPEHLNSGIYLIIGVFEYEANAKGMVDNAKSEGLDANYGINPTSGYFYVYTNSSSDMQKISERYYQVRNTTKFVDAWVLNIKDEGFTEDKKDEGQLDVNELSASTETYLQPQIINKQTTKDATLEEPSSKVVVIVNTLNSDNGDNVEASIELVDGLRAKLISKTTSGTPYVIEEKTVLDTVHVVSEVLGFRKMQLDLIPNNPINNTTQLYTHASGDSIFVNMELVELQRGDFQIMYNTYFYGNSTVMRDHSKYELDKLYQIMKDKPNMKIKLHGHTNGNSRGLAYLYDKDEKNYFQIRRTKEYSKKGVSSKKLSAYRAETIKSYLIDKGINTNRIQTQGWGGNKLLYETDSPLAKNNIRVEIEVLNK